MDLVEYTCSIFGKHPYADRMSRNNICDQIWRHVSVGLFREWSQHRRLTHVEQPPSILRHIPNFRQSLHSKGGKVQSIHYQDWRHLREHRHREQAHLDPGSHLECQLRRSMPVYRSIRGLDSMHFATGRKLGEPRPNDTATVQCRPNANLDRHGSQSPT
jgi:hypothetical protein